MSYDAESFLKDTSVSRETLDDLTKYAELLGKWTSRINLISKNSIGDMWYRHFLDSQQIVAHTRYVPKKWVDIGSGAGFPGLVVAILQKTIWPNTHFTLVESDQRKAAFLLNVVRETGANADIVSKRIEAADPQGADILSARALAPLSDLLAHAERHCTPAGEALFLKGARATKELEEARKNWRFKCEEFASKTDPTGVILRIGELARA